MILNIQDDFYPFQSSTQATKQCTTILKRTFALQSSQSSQQIIQKTYKLIQTPLKNLIAIRFYQESVQQVKLYYEKVEQHLSQFLDQMDENDIKVMHQQFIDLIISLAKTGIVTTFDCICCGACSEAEGIVLKYFLDASKITITDDLKIIEESVYNFCQQAMQYMVSCKQRKSKVLKNDDSHSKAQFHLKKSKKSSSQVSENSLKGNIDNHRLSVYSKESKSQKKNNKETSLRKLSVLSRELSEISARHRGAKNVPLQLYGKFSLQTTHSNQNIDILSQNECLSPTLPMVGSMPTPLLLARSKRAKGLLLELKEKLTPYHQIYTILKQIKIKS